MKASVRERYKTGHREAGQEPKKRNRYTPSRQKVDEILLDMMATDRLNKMIEAAQRMAKITLALEKEGIPYRYNDQGKLVIHKDFADRAKQVLVSMEILGQVTYNIEERMLI
jgi:DNA-binding TFAR19-related protein (PDSD5 family)